MAQKFPRDRFDSIPHGIERVGAHRAPARRGAGWIAFGWAALATVVLVAVGIGGVVVLQRSAELRRRRRTHADTPDARLVTAAPTVAPDIPVTVLNGTTTVGPGRAGRRAAHRGGHPRRHDGERERRAT